MEDFLKLCLAAALGFLGSYIVLAIRLATIKQAHTDAIRRIEVGETRLEHLIEVTNEKLSRLEEGQTKVESILEFHFAKPKRT